MSSFLRASAKEHSVSHRSSLVPGVKPWIHSGQGIVSSGHKQLDGILGEGCVLGTAVLIENDSYSNFGETIVSYNIAESVSLGHDTLVVCAAEREARRMLQQLPFNLSCDEDHSSSVSVMESGKNESGVSGLKIAWQYEKYLSSQQKESSPSDSLSAAEDCRPNRYCCSYDLSRRLQPSLFEGSIVRQICCRSDTTSLGLIEGLREIFEGIASFCTEMKASEERDTNESSDNIKSNVQRIYLHNFHQILEHYSYGSQSSPSDIECAVSQFLLKLKHLVRGSRTLLLVSVDTQRICNRNIRTRMAQCSDTVLSLESFAGHAHSVPYEFQEFHGFFKVLKLQSYGTLNPPRPGAIRYGLKRDRRKLHIEPLHLPPEESRSFGSAGTDQHFEKKAAAAQLSALKPSYKDNSLAASAVTLKSTPAARVTPLQASLAALRAERNKAGKKTAGQGNAGSGDPFDF